MTFITAADMQKNRTPFGARFFVFFSVFSVIVEDAAGVGDLVVAVVILDSVIGAYAADRTAGISG